MNNELNFDKDIYNTIRKNIRKYRKEKGITSAKLAEMVDLSHDFIRQIQSDKASYNDIVSFAEIENELQLDSFKYHDKDYNIYKNINDLSDNDLSNNDLSDIDKEFDEIANTYKIEDDSETEE